VTTTNSSTVKHSDRDQRQKLLVHKFYVQRSPHGTELFKSNVGGVSGLLYADKLSAETEEVVEFLV
jgi:hypothetical protein